jgi:hypothetical protein
MYHGQNLIRRLGGCAVLALLCIMSTPPVAAADEDIDIPYTDTYGYVYDPATGTYIKQDPPTAAVIDVTGTAETANAPLTATGSVSAPVPATQTAVQSSAGIATTMVVVLLLAGGALGYVFTTRRMKGRTSNKADSGRWTSGD